MKEGSNISWKGVNTIYEGTVIGEYIGCLIVRINGSMSCMLVDKSNVKELSHAAGN